MWPTNTNNSLPLSERITPKQTSRIEYIDAIRGFTMFLVVINHLAAKYDLTVGSFHYYLKLVRMPMFFLISGFVFYKIGVVWDKKQIVTFFKKKIPIQLIGPLIFFIVFVHVRIDPNIFWEMFISNKYGYWFTFVLFEYFVFYITVRVLVRNSKWSDIILVLMGICFYPLSYPPIIEAIPIPNDILNFFSVPFWHFFIFFVLGTLLKKHFVKIQKWLDGKWLITICVLVFFLWNVVRDIVPLPKAIFDIPLELSGLVLLFSFFRSKQKVFSKERAVGRAFQYVGRRTLDIYLIHFFLIPTGIPLYKVFSEHSMPVVEFFVSSIIALVIIGVCLIIGNILRLSPLIAHYFFGVKEKKTS